jgi:SAM-dependent methyltransferase
MRDSAERFTGRAALYAKSRPGYPDEAIAYLQSEVGIGPGSVVADIGSGPGQSSEPFVMMGCEVFAVEPNGEMRAIAEARFARVKNFHSVATRAEATGLEAASVDVVVSATAFHWFDKEAARREFLRILKPGGKVALMWNRRATDRSAFLREYEQALLAHSAEYRERWSKDREDFTPVIQACFGHSDYRTTQFENVQWCDWEGLTARLLSASYSPLPGDPEHGPLLERVRRAFEDMQEEGRVALVYETVVYHGRLDGPPK